MTFDIVIGNPPYQESNGSATSTPIWHKFVQIAFEVCKDNGYVSLVHPGSWRLDMPKFRTTRDLITSNDVVYLNMNSTKQGLKVFGAGTSFDYYLCRKAANTGNTTAVGFCNTHTSLDLRGQRFIPHAEFDFYSSLLAKDGKEKVETLANSSYHTQRSHVTKAVGKYPVVYSIRQDRTNLLYTDDRSKGHFGVPKVIVSNGSGGNILADPNGDYAMAEFCHAIVVPKEDVPAVAEFLSSSSFREAMKNSQISGNLIDKGMCRNLRKDFWK